MIGRWTHREYLTRLAWLDEQWNQPSRADHYLMQVAQEVRRVLHKNPGQVLLDHFRIPFVQKKPKKKLKPEDRKAKQGRFKRMMISCFPGLKRKTVERDRT